MLKGTPLDTGAFLDRLKKIAPEEQCAVIERELEAARKPKKAPARAPEPQDDDGVREQQVAALMAAWNRAGKEARAEFLRRIGDA